MTSIRLTDRDLERMGLAGARQAVPGSMTPYKPGVGMVVKAMPETPAASLLSAALKDAKTAPGNRGTPNKPRRRQGSGEAGRGGETAGTQPTTLQMLSEQIGDPKKPRAKYNNEKTEIDGITFDSRKEAARYRDLRQLEQAGIITDLELQPRFTFEIDGSLLRYHSQQINRDGSARLGKPIMYFADFAYTETSTGARVVEDTKGYRTPDFLIKLALMQHVNNIEVQLL